MEFSKILGLLIIFMLCCRSVLLRSGLPRFLHTAGILNGLMIVVGGNPHNDTSQSRGAHCYSNNIMIYDILCGDWKIVDKIPENVREILPRFGHAATTFNNSLYMFGGFNGQMLSDIIK